MRRLLAYAIPKDVTIRPMNLMLSIICGISIGTWLYAKVLRPRTMDAKTPLIASAAVAVILTLIFYFTANILIPQS